MKYQQFHDFDAYASLVQDAEIIMLLHNLKRRFWSIAQVQLDGISVQIGQEGSGNITEGQSRSDGYLLFIPFNNASAHAANGTYLDENSIAILEPGCDFCVRCKTEHDWCSIFIPTHKLVQDNNLIKSSSSSQKTACRVTRSNPQLRNQLLAIISEIMSTDTNCRSFESSIAAELVAAELTKITSSLLGQRQVGKPNREGRPRKSRQEIIHSSMNLLENHGNQPVRIEKLAIAAQVSERTLRTAFYEYFGISPIRYLQIRQLNQIYRALLLAEPEECRVSEVMVKYGIWDFSRCTSRYRQLFGELPSETLRR